MWRRSSVSRREDSLRVEGAFGRLLVLEHQVQVFALSEEVAGARADGGDIFWGVVGLAQAVVDEVRGDDFGNFEAVGLGDAEGDSVVAQERIDVFDEPGLVAELEGEAEVAG